MATRRAHMERTLKAERIALWGDVSRALPNSYPTSARIADLVRRIRVIGEALGEPTDWTDIPAPLLSWYQMVETVPELGLVAQHFEDWEVQKMFGSTPEDRYWPDDSVRKFYSHPRSLPRTSADPDDEDWGDDG